MSGDSIKFITELPNGVRLIWLLSWDSKEGYISLKHVNFTIDPLKQVFIQEGSKRTIVGGISTHSNEDGYTILLEPCSTEVLYGHT